MIFRRIINKPSFTNAFAGRVFQYDPEIKNISPIDGFRGKEIELLQPFQSKRPLINLSNCVEWIAASIDRVVLNGAGRRVPAHDGIRFVSGKSIE